MKTTMNISTIAKMTQILRVKTRTLDLQIPTIIFTNRLKKGNSALFFIARIKDLKKVNSK